ncbi:polygalacturonase [Herbihabitans rhizosphaerae]|uniref:Polygalacturonase n=1 Tax=Herbihabitans rhizosphaerae TaxID=1872711 RepID=A0A4Q7L9D1_9PSEU|nr:glycoside hydrolase family 28 protein [Herbihabitans rhizosphaerae]RZS45042.1 polygalacturonase [Herbihabitans rhizosphaerae]
MAKSISRRHIVAMGAAGVAGVAGAALVPGTAAGAASSTPTGDSSRVFDVTRFGAKGDGVTIDSDAVNRAIDEAAEARPHSAGGPGGTVYFPAGRYACYSIRLKSNVALHLAQGATLLAAKPAGGKGYDPPEPGTDNPYQDFAHSHWHNSLIWGEGLTGVTIFGPGVIDGKGLVGGRGENDPGAGNKAIALKLCRNVTIRDITLLNGGSLAILPTGVDNLRIDNLVIDTYSDGINLDCCRNVRIANTTVNTPNADSIVLKSSYALGEARATENVTIDNCMVSGYDLGTLYDGTFKTEASHERVGRIKFGTESNGGFKNIAISNVIFERCHGLALQTVDGGLLEDVTISNLTMRHVRMPIFLRLGSRMRGPAGAQIGRLRRVSISDVIVHDADPRYPSTIAGIPGHPVEDIRISNVRHSLAGGLTPGDVNQNPPEEEGTYPETDMFGSLPAYGLFIRHATGITLDNVEVRFEKHDTRPAYALRDVADADFHHNRADKVQGTPTFVLDDVDDFIVTTSRPVPDTRIDHTGHQEL